MKSRDKKVCITASSNSFQFPGVIKNKITKVRLITFLVSRNEGTTISTRKRRLKQILDQSLRSYKFHGAVYSGPGLTEVSKPYTMVPMFKIMQICQTKRYHRYGCDIYVHHFYAIGKFIM